jgi:organic radical activating enzyme
VINGSTILHLNQSAAEYAYYLVQNLPPESVGTLMSRRYTIDRNQAASDYLSVTERIQTLVTTPDLDPITFLDFDRARPYNGPISIPYRMDCAVTYAIAEGTTSGVTPTERVVKELTTEEWVTIIDKAWKVGIPHIVFTGGEPMLRADLLELIARAESNGQITGILTDGSHLIESEYLQQLLQTGLDHILLVFDPDRAESWDNLTKLLKEDIFVAVHLTLNENNSTDLRTAIHSLSEKGVKAISLSSTSQELKSDLLALRQLLADLQIELVWNLPVPYSTMNPVRMEVKYSPPEGAGKAWIYVEPDGDILKAQGNTQVIGNWLTDTWDTIHRQLLSGT